jgi:hypothetical protein
MTSTLLLRTTLAAFVCTGALALVSPSMAETIMMKADLKGSNEVPPNPSKATGAVALTYDTASKKLTWKGSYAGLSGPATAAHLHAGEPGKNGGVAIPMGGADKSPFEGEATLTDTQALDLMAGRLYVNIHTAASKAGEVRGQVQR